MNRLLIQSAQREVKRLRAENARLREALNDARRMIPVLDKVEKIFTEASAEDVFDRDDYLNALSARNALTETEAK